MADFSTHKVVAAIPATPEANAVYFVRTGTGYKQFVTDVAGVAFPVVSPQRAHFSARITMTNNRWTGPDDQRGVGNENWVENYGTGATPNLNNSDGGMVIPAGAVIKKLDFFGRFSAAALTFDMDVAIFVTTAAGVTTLITTGVLNMNGNLASTSTVIMDHSVTDISAFNLALRPQGDPGTNRRIFGHFALEYDQQTTL